MKLQILRRTIKRTGWIFCKNKREKENREEREEENKNMDPHRPPKSDLDVDVASTSAFCN